MRNNYRKNRYNEICVINLMIIFSWMNIERFNGNSRQTNYRYDHTVRDKEKINSRPGLFRKYSNDQDDRTTNRNCFEHNYSSNIYKCGQRGDYSQYRPLNRPRSRDYADGRIVSETKCFKIVSEGNIIHDESSAPQSSSDNSAAHLTETQLEKFATSRSIIGPESNTISIPSFLSLN